MLTKEKKEKIINSFDIIIGSIVNILSDNTFKMRVNRIGSHNIFSYHDYETIRLLHNKVKFTHDLIGKNVKCKIYFRNEYNILIADIESLIL